MVRAKIATITKLYNYFINYIVTYVNRLNFTLQKNKPKFFLLTLEQVCFLPKFSSENSMYHLLMLRQ